MQNASQDGSRLGREAAEAEAVARRLALRLAPVLPGLVARLRAHPPSVVATCARGSSDHAATFGKYVLERAVGLPVASLGPSLASVYGGTPALAGALFIAVSQSGRSPDTLRLTEAARAGGALVAVMLNDEGAPLAALADVLLPLAAGPEHSVAATKSFLAAGLAFLHLAAAWSGDPALTAAVAAAPDALAAAGSCHWGQAMAGLHAARSLYVIGRGPGLGVALEMALKLKETCGIHAEAFSAAEVLHGPLALVGPGFPVLVLDPGDEGGASVLETAGRLAEVGATVLYAGRDPAPGWTALPLPQGRPVSLLPLLQARAFYGGLARLAEARGLDPDTPPHLRKVTRTL